MLLVVTADVNHRVATHALRPLLERHHGRQEIPLARLFIGLVEGIGLFIGHELTEILGDLRVTLVTEIETDILVKLLLCILGIECFAD